MGHPGWNFVFVINLAYFELLDCSLSGVYLKLNLKGPGAAVEYADGFHNGNFFHRLPRSRFVWVRASHVIVTGCDAS